MDQSLLQAVQAIVFTRIEAVAFLLEVSSFIFCQSWLNDWRVLIVIVGAIWRIKNKNS